jgi:uncharacterized membrane protein (DUF2068 family)
MSDIRRDFQAGSTTTRKPRRDRWIAVIAVFKAFKAIALILVAVAAFHLDGSKNFEHVVRWLEQLSLSDSDGLRWRLVDKLQSMGPTKFVAVGVVALAYAAIFATEGIGLWLQKHWAQWFTVIATGSLVPVEIYEVVHRFSVFKLAALIVNILIVVYLIRVALQPRQSRSAK